MIISYDKPFCVYFHKVEDDIVYIGSGTFSRAFDINPTQRNPLWGTVTLYRDIEVQIVSAHSDRDAAYGAEKRMIDMLQPVCNIAIRTVPKRVRSKVRCLQTGEIYASTTAAARALGLSPGSVSNVVNGRWESVSGYTFFRVS